MFFTTHEQTTPEKILGTAFQLLSSKGYANVSLRSIAGKAGVALGQVSYHYHTKEELISSVVRQVTDACVEKLDALICEDMTRRERLLTAAEYFRRLFTENRDLARFVVDFTGQAMWTAVYQKQMNAFFTRISAVLAKGASEDKNDDLRPNGGFSAATAAKFAVAALYGTAVEALLGQRAEETDRVFCYAEHVLLETDI